MHAMPFTYAVCMQGQADASSSSEMLPQAPEET